MVTKTYSDCFWGEDLSSCQGTDALSKRNHDGKKMCQELEEYLKKRAKLEYEFSKSLKSLNKCFKHKEQMGNLESAINSFKHELDNIANSHHGAGEFFTKQADSVRAFKDEQASKRKQIEDDLIKMQSSKLNNLLKIKQLEKTYVKKSVDRDVAENHYKELERDNTQGKEIEKAKSRLLKNEEEAQKADEAYKSGVIVLESVTVDWEQMMDTACKIIQVLDEKRVHYLREELWVSVNVDSKLALDIDNCCETVRNQLGKCVIVNDIQAFLQSSSTGTAKPRHYSFRHYTRLRENDSDTESSTSSTENEGTLPRNNPKGGKIFTKIKNPLKP